MRVFTREFYKTPRIFGLVIFSAVIASTVSDPCQAQPTYAEGRIIVKAKPGVSDTDLSSVLNAHGANGIRAIGRLPLKIVNVPVQSEKAIVEALMKRPQIEFAELDQSIALDQITPNDPNYSSQWHLPKIGAPTAWDITTGSSVIVAILDTGVDISHPDLTNQFLPGWNSVDQSTSYNDINGHGTMVAGTVGAVANNSTGIASVAFSAKLLPVRVTNDSGGYAYYSDIARGLEWAANYGAKVANVSYSIASSSTITTAAQYMRSKGGLVVSSAGNSGNEVVMSANPDIISVSATTSSDTLASWSSYGAYVDVSAPGDYILTTQKGGTYIYGIGTSFSSPVTAGTVALIMSANSTLAPATVEDILKTTTVDLGSSGWDKQYGYGRIDAAAAVAKAIGTRAADSTSPSISESLANNSTVSATVSISVIASDNVGVTKIDMLVNGVLYGSANTTSTTFSWNTLSYNDGNATLEFRAYDAAGNVGRVSISVTIANNVVVDTTPPTVTILSPSNGATVTGNAKFSQQGSDNVAVSQMSCYFDGKLISTVTNSSTQTCTINTRKISVGAHIYSVTARDAAGNQANASINLNVAR